MKTLNIDAKGKDKDPEWMQVTDAGVTITLSTPSEMNGVKVPKISLRSPTIREVRACQAAHPGDEAAVDAMLFASLAEIGEKDVIGLTVKDYNRVNRGYFRLVDEDEL
ncbi:MAG TPA: phage tail assembly protein [Pseudomonas sp.]|uniref:phage tail assembly protein n=1 Tax=Pseudomonas sp. TaxID=306 RepID=UPI002ED910AB